MHETPDQELLRRYVEQGAEEAFTELVRRHCNLVWAAAKRVSGNGEVARDVTQVVFTDLAHKARRMPSETVLAGWLYRAACHAAAKQVRGESRRAQREQQQAMNQHESPSADTAGTHAAEELQPLLDAALAELPDPDRDAVVLRFFAGRSLAEVGAVLGTNEDAAQKRVSRALEKLRDAFRRRGVAVSSGLVGAALGLAGTQAAPVGLAAAVAGGALAAGGGVALGTVSLIALMKTKLALGLGVAVAATVVLVHQQGRLHRLTEENAALRQQVATLAPATTSATAASLPRETGEFSRFQGEHEELLRLRGEVARLRQAASAEPVHRLQTAEARTARAEEEAAAVKAEVAFHGRRVQIVNAGKNLGLAARLFANDHEDHYPTTIEEMRAYMHLDTEGTFPGGISPENFEFFPQPRVIGLNEPQLILFREREARAVPQGVLTPEELSRAGLEGEPLQKGWQRAYVLVDGSVQSQTSATGDFAEFERAGTAAVASPP